MSEWTITKQNESQRYLCVQTLNFAPLSRILVATYTVATCLLVAGSRLHDALTTCSLRCRSSYRQKGLPDDHYRADKLGRQNLPPGPLGPLDLGRARSSSGDGCALNSCIVYLVRAFLDGRGKQGRSSASSPWLSSHSTITATSCMKSCLLTKRGVHLMESIIVRCIPARQNAACPNFPPESLKVERHQCPPPPLVPCCLQFSVNLVRAHYTS